MQRAVLNLFGLACIWGVGISPTSAVASETQSPERAGTAEEISAAQRDFFEKHIRPVLVSHCYECHAADSKQLRGGLRLDTRAAVRAGGDSGAAIVPGDADASLLIESIRYGDDSYQMPPQGKLPDAVIKDFETWVNAGAADPRIGGSNELPERDEINLVAGREFWHFQPPQRVTPPAVEQTTWPRSPVDRFILASLEEKGLQPAPDADRRTLLRRVYFDLIGLPPTPGQIADFLADESPSALETVVDRLLASPRFGERWGRHWLDVVRFAESSGGGRTLIFPNAWRFRDYVIAAMNDDRPFDQFIREQIAGDLLPYDSAEQRRRQLTGTGFLALGPTNYELQDKELLRMEVVDEQIDTIGRAFLGLTLGCARCHDHKFDPIPTQDYYALAGIFRSTKTFLPGNVARFVETELPVPDEKKQAYEEFQKQEKRLTSQLAKFDAEQKKLSGRIAAITGRPAQAAKGKIDATELVGIVLDDTQAKVVGDWTPSTSEPPFLNLGYIHDGNTNQGEKEVVFAPDLPATGRYEVRISYSPASNRARAALVTITHANGKETVRVDQRKVPPIGGAFASLGEFEFNQGNSAAVRFSNKNAGGHVIVDCVQFVPLEVDPKSADALSKRERAQLASEKAAQEEAVAALQEEQAALKKQRNAIEDELKKVRADAPKLPQTMSVQEESKPGDWHLHVRGGIRNLGEIVPRGFLSVVSVPDSVAIPEDQSGRRELAQWIARPDNPMTARVYVNRLWHHLFGRGLVRTTDNFGRMGERPSHPELLDWLAVDFLAHGWSTKHTIRQIVLSRTYQMAHVENEQAAAVDPENRLLWRAKRRRLDAEAIRDAMLLVSGELDLTAGGPAMRSNTRSELGYKFQSVRRSVYVPFFRNTQFELFQVFDVANPNLVNGHRATSTLPTQALFMMNSPFTLEHSRHAAQRLLAIGELSKSQRIDWAYESTLGRPPRVAEQQLMLDYLAGVKADSPAEVDAWAQIIHTLYACIDFRYVH